MKFRSFFSSLSKGMRICLSSILLVSSTSLRSSISFSSISLISFILFLCQYQSLGNGIILANNAKYGKRDLILRDQFKKEGHELFKKIEDFIKPLNIDVVIDFSCRSTFVFSESYKDYKMEGVERFKGGVRIKRDSPGVKEFLNLWDNHEPNFNFGGYISLLGTTIRAFSYILNKLGKPVHIFSPDPRYSKLYREKIYTFAADDMYYPITEDFKVDVIKHGYVTPQYLTKGLFSSSIPSFKHKKADLIFFGTVSSERNDSRILMYKQYLMDLSGSVSLYYKKIKGNVQKYQEEHDHMLNNKYHVDFEISYDQCTSELLRHKYSFVPSPIIHNSYHRRIAHAVALNNLPLVAHDYDPLNKQLPEKFNDVLRVSSSSDIMKKIEYFNEHPDEAQSIIDEIKQYMGFGYLTNKEDIKKYIIEKLEL